MTATASNPTFVSATGVRISSSAAATIALYVVTPGSITVDVAPIMRRGRISTRRQPTASKPCSRPSPCPQAGTCA